MNADEYRTLDEIGDIPLTLCAELDRKRIRFSELLDLQEGSIVNLTRPAGENVDLYAGEIYLGSGEILVLEGRLAIRLADIGDQTPNMPRKLAV